MPLVVFPYISRVLGPKGVGEVDSVDAFINYAIQLATMGLSTLGIREIAKCRDDKEKLIGAFRDLFTLNLITTSLLAILLTSIFCFFPYFHEQRQLYFIGLTKLVFNMFWIEWFFKGMENFRYITLRSIAMRLLFVVAVFIFVRDESDYVVYYILWVGLVAGNAMCNWLYRGRMVPYRLRGFCAKRYLAPFVSLGLFSICAAVYTQLPTVFLKLQCDDASEVAYYTTATRVHTILLALFTSVTGVLIPRMSSYLGQGKKNEARDLVHKSFLLLCLFAFPVIIFLEFFAPDVICLFAGNAFGGAVLPMRIVALQIIVIGSEQILILQLLIPSGHDKYPLICALSGAATSVLLNLILVPRLGAIGCAISWVVAEVVVLSSAIHFIRRFFSILLPFRFFAQQLLLAAPYLCIALIVYFVMPCGWVRLVVSCLLFVVYAIVLVLKMNIVEPHKLLEKIRR